jgi:hypothetical protein
MADVYLLSLLLAAGKRVVSVADDEVDMRQHTAGTHSRNTQQRR